MNCNVSPSADSDSSTSSYLVYNPELIVISNDRYLERFDPINNIKENGKILINSEKTNNEVHIKWDLQ